MFRKPTTEVEQSQTSVHGKQLQLDHPTFRSVLRTHRRLNEAIRSSVKYELLAKGIAHEKMLAQHPDTRREVSRRARQARFEADVRRERERRKILYGLQRLARRWHARLAIAPESWLLQRHSSNRDGGGNAKHEGGSRTRRRNHRHQSAR